MKKTIKVMGLDCPVCASGLEKILRAIDGITEVTVTYPLGKIELEYENEATLECAIRAINGFEEVRVIDETAKLQPSDGKRYASRWLRMGLSAVILLLAIFCSAWGKEWGQVLNETKKRAMIGMR